jgi:hypothetical protein
MIPASWSYYCLEFHSFCLELCNNYNLDWNIPQRPMLEGVLLSLGLSGGSRTFKMWV